MPYWHKHGDGWKTPVPMEEDPLLDTDMLMSEFSDTLFSTLSSHQPVAWPNPREIGNLLCLGIEAGLPFGAAACHLSRPGRQEPGRPTSEGRLH